MSDRKLASYCPLPFGIENNGQEYNRLSVGSSTADFGTLVVIPRAIGVLARLNFLGITTFALLFREAGFEVIYMGLHNTAEEIYEAAVQENVDVIGVSFLSGQHLPQMKKILDHIRDEDDFLVIVGGVIPKADIPELKKMGVDRVFPPGTMHGEAVAFIKAHMGQG